MAGEVSEYLSGEQSEFLGVQTEADKFVKGHVGAYDQEELERWTSKYRSLSSKEQQKEIQVVRERLEKSVDRGNYGEMGLEFAMLVEGGQGFDIPTKLSYVNRVLSRNIYNFYQQNSQRRSQEPYSENFHRRLLNDLGELQRGLDLANKLHVLTPK